MRIRDSMPFADAVFTPSWKESFRRPDAVPRPGDIILDGAWRVRIDGSAGADLAVRRAAQHLTAFLRESLAVPLRTPQDGPAVRLRVDPGLDANAETHCLRVAPTGVEIVGAGPAGVLHGVFRLEQWLRERGGPFLATGEQTFRPAFKHRIHRSCFSPFYVEELTGLRGA